MIHTKLYRKECESAFPELMADYKLGMLPDPPEAINWIKSGRGEFGYERPEHLRGFVDPQLLEPRNRVPHECMGIVGTVHRILDANGVPSRDRFLHTQIRDDSPLYVGHWEIEAGGKLWDSSIPHRSCIPYENRLDSTGVYDMAITGDDMFYSLRDFNNMLSRSSAQPEDVMRALAMKTLAYDAWSMVNGAIMVGRQRLVFDDVPLGSSMDIEPQSRLLENCGKELRNSVAGGDNAEIRDLLNKYQAHLISK